MENNIRVMTVVCRAAFIWLASLALSGPSQAREDTNTHTQASSDEFYVRGWGGDNGLAAGNIISLARTRDGFLWLATDVGLTCFDGLKFQILDRNQFPTVDRDQVSCLLVDRQGVLWAGTGQGYLFRREGAGFREVSIGTVIDRSGISSLAEGNDGSLWVATRRTGVWFLRQGQWQMVPSSSELNARPTAQVVPDKNGQIWVVSSTSLMLYDPKQNRLSKVDAFTNQPVLKIAAGQDGSLWAATMATPGRGTRLFRFKEGAWSEPDKTYHWDQASMWAMPNILFEDNTGRLWLGTAGSGIFFHSQSGTWQSLSHPGPLADQRANAIYQDQEGTLWFGLQGGQLFLAHKREVRALWPEDSGAQSIFQTACLCRDGSVWGGTDGAGVFCYRNGHWKQYGPKEGLSSQYVFGLYEDSLTNLWAATRGGLFHWDGSRFRRAGFMPRPNGFVLGLFEDRSGALWAATHQGLVRRLGESTTEYAPDNRQGTGPDIRAFAEDPEGNIWVAINGVGIFCQHGSRFEHVFPKAVPGGIDFRAMLFDADGALWVATFGNGLIQIKTNGVRNWTARDGLPSNNLVALVEDKSGMLWFGSHNGIFGLDRNALNNYVPGESSPLLARQLSVAEGLASRICSGWGQPVAGSDQDGRLCFPNQRALAVFDPAAIKSSPLSLPVQIDAIQANGTSVPVGSNSTVRIPSGVRRVAFKYTVADVLNPERVHFRYRLKPVKNDWVDTQNRDVEYDFLPPGDYEFHVMASRSDGVWSESDFPIKLIVTPRLWERTSVRVAVAGLLFGTIAAVAWMVIRARFQRRLLRLEAQQAAELERRRIARDLHDELGSGLTEIMQLGDLGSEEAMAPDDLRGNARTIAQRTRRLAAALDEIVWTTNPRNDSLPKFTGYLCDYAQEFMRPSPVRCRLDVVSVPENIRLKAAVRHNLLLACKEALRNVVRHSGAREVWLRMRYDAGKLQIIVEDDGRGFNSDSLPSRGNGLRNMRERIEACGGKIDFSTALGKGSKLTFELMLGANN